MWRGFTRLVASTLCLFQATTSALAQDQTCARSDFEAVVDDAAAVLRDLNAKNKPLFQNRLRDLKEKRGWDHGQFLEEAAPFVRDEKIAVFDKMSQDLINAISTLGQAGAEAATPDCSLLVKLRENMDTLVKAQTDKWTYMFNKLEAAISQ